MFARLICIFVVATILAAFTSAEEQNLRAGKPSIAFPHGSALKFADAMIRKFSNDAVGIDTTSAFRGPEGQLLNIEPTINYADVSPHLAALAPCPTNPGTGSSIYYGTGSYQDPTTKATLSFTYAMPLPTVSTSIVENFCLTLSGSLSAVNMNYNAATNQPITPSIAMQGITGTSCKNCYAYVGATIALGLKCDASVGLNNSVSCTVAFDTSGSTKFNMDFEMINPSMSTNGPVTALYTQATATKLYNDPLTGIYVNANPSLNYQFQGSISTTGTANIVAGFATSAGFTITATAGTTSNQVSLVGFAGATLTPPSVTSTLQLQSIDFSVVVNPTVSWVFGIGCGSGTTSSVCVSTGSSETGVGFSVVIETPFTATYNWQQASAASSPTSSLLLTAQANLNNIVLDAEFATKVPAAPCTSTGLFSYSYTLPTQACITVLATPVQSPSMQIYTAAGSQSLGAAAVPVIPSPTAKPTFQAGAPTPAPTTGSGGGGTTSSKGNDGENNSLDGGAITGIVIATLMVACGVAFAVYHFYFKGKTSLANEDEKKTTTANPVHDVELT